MASFSIIENNGNDYNDYKKKLLFPRTFTNFMAGKNGPILGKY